MILSNKEWRSSPTQVASNKSERLVVAGSDMMEPEYARAGFSKHGSSGDSFDPSFELDDNTDISHSGPVSVSLNFRSEEEGMVVMAGNRLSHRSGNVFSPSHPDRSSEVKRSAKRSFLHRSRFSSDSVRRLHLLSLQGRNRTRSIIFISLMFSISLLVFIRPSSLSILGSSMPTTNQKEELRQSSELRVKQNAMNSKQKNRPKPLSGDLITSSNYTLDNTQKSDDQSDTEVAHPKDPKSSAGSILDEVMKARIDDSTRSSDSQLEEETNDENSGMVHNRLILKENTTKPSILKSEIDDISLDENEVKEVSKISSATSNSVFQSQHQTNSVDLESSSNSDSIIQSKLATNSSTSGSIAQSDAAMNSDPDSEFQVHLNSTSDSVSITNTTSLATKSTSDSEVMHNLALDDTLESNRNLNSTFTLSSNHEDHDTNLEENDNETPSQDLNATHSVYKIPYDADVYERLFSPPKFKGYKKCIRRSKNTRGPPEFPHGYLLVTANGGLNQMRTAICDMVAIARLMKATLVIPYLDHTSFWADPSEFGDIFDVDHFINELKDDVTIIKSLEYPFNRIKPYEKNPISWSTDIYYKTEIVPLMKKYKVVHFLTSDTRLANNNLPFSLQRLRCRTNFLALKFTPTISNVADAILHRLRQKGPYIALHLRYEKDMLAFTGCDKGLTKAESEELRSLRYGFSRWKEKEIDGDEKRKQGLCPLTPRETSLVLQAMGFPNNTVIYIAAGDIYGSAGLKELTSYYPLVYSHKSLATEEELQSLGHYQNRLAAVDYTISTQSDVFIFTYDGNMARTVQGYRRYMGHMRTILPDRKAIVKLVDKLDAGKTTWKSFSKGIRRVHKSKEGHPRIRRVTPSNPKSEDYFYANPFPECICESRFARRKRIASEASEATGI